MSDYHDEVADMMAASRTVGPYVDRATILKALRAQYPSEAALRAQVEGLARQVKRVFADPAIALLAPPLPGNSTWELLFSEDHRKGPVR